MKILGEFQDAKGFDVFIGLTYGCDLAWFERVLGRPLRAAGVRRFLILADQQQLSLTVASQLDQIRGAGRWYASEGVRADGAFHPKAFFLAGAHRARLWIGSGNLRASGVNRNREVFERWEVEEADAEVPAAFEEFRRYLDRVLARLMPRVPDHVAEIVDEAFACRVLGKPVGEGANMEIVGSPTALFEQLPRPSSPALRLRAVAPFFDDGGALVLRLADHFGAGAFEVITDPAISNLTPSAIERIEARGGTVRLTIGERPVHAKLIEVVGADWAIGIHGSANLSISAWAGRNAELAVVRYRDAALEVGRLIDQLAPTADLDAETIALLARRAAEREFEPLPNETRAAGLSISSSCWRGAAVAVVRHGSTPVPTALEVTTGASSPLMIPVAVEGALAFEVVVPMDLDRSGVVVVRLWAGDIMGPASLVHDAGELTEWAKGLGRHERRLAGYLEADPADADLADAYIEVCVRMLEERAARRRSDLTAPDGEDDGRSDRRHDAVHWTFVREVDFADSDRSPVQESKASRDLDPAGLLRRVLFGDVDEDDDDASEGESESDGENDVSSGTTGSRGEPRGLERRKQFRRAVEQASSAYLEDLARYGGRRRSAERLLDDLLVLAIGAHRGLRVGTLSASEYLAATVPVLREVFGRADSPLPVALRGMRETPSPIDNVSCGWILSAVAVLLYNVCLAEIEARGVDEDPVTPDFPHVAPVLWFRHAYVHLADDRLTDLALRHVGRLRRVGLWVADLWPFSSEKVPFPSFLHQMVTDAAAVTAVDQRFRDTLRTSLGPRLRTRVDEIEEAAVVGIGRDGALAVGFLDLDQDGRTFVGRLHDGAFQRAEPSGWWSRMHKATVGMRMDALLEQAGTDETLFAGLHALNRLTW